MRKQTEIASFTLLFISLILIEPTQGAIVYHDDFQNSDEGAELGLGGDAPTIRNALYGGSSNATWLTTTPNYWGSDGSKIAGTVNAFLPVTIPSTTNGIVYTLSVDISVAASSGGDWLAIGFANSNSGVFWDLGAPWALLRGQTTSGDGSGLDATPNTGRAFSRFEDNGANLVLGGANELGPYMGTFQIQIDTNPEFWTTTWSFRESGQSDFTDFHLYQFSASDPNPNINYVGVGAVNNGSGYIDNFTLTAVPEPTTTSLFSILVIASLLMRRRAATTSSS